MYINASAAVRIVSAIIKPRYQGHIHNSFIKRITCIVYGKRFGGVYEHGKSLRLEINHDVLPNETLQLHFTIDDVNSFSQQYPIAMISNNYEQPLFAIEGEHQFRNTT